MSDFNYKADVILKNIAETWNFFFFCWDTLFVKVIRNLASTKVVRRHFFPLTPKEVKDLFLRQTEQKRMWLGTYQDWQREMVRNQTETRGINWTAAGWTVGPIPYSFQLPSLFDSKSTGN